MALHSVVLALCLATLLLWSEPSACENVKGSVSCLDCDHDYSLSGIMVAVKCDKVRKLTMVATESDGSFSAEIPSDSASKTTAAAPINCLAKLIGGSDQLYATRKNLVSKVIELHNNEHSNSYTIVSPLAFSTTCPLAKEGGKCGGGLGSSKTIDIPLPPEWGFAPSSYYIGVIPIIGVP